MLHFFDLFTAEIQFLMTFSFFVVHARVFVNIKISFQKKTYIAHNPLLRARRGLLRSFLDLQFFIFLNIKFAYFRKKTLKTLLNLRIEERSFVTFIIFRCFSPRKSDFKFNLLITFDLTAVDNF